MIKQWYYQSAQCGSKKSRFIKNQEAKGLLSKLGIKVPLSEVPILGEILFNAYKDELNS